MKKVEVTAPAVEDDDYAILNLQQVAESLSVCTMTVRRLIDAGKLTKVQVSTRRVGIERKSIKEYIKRQRMASQTGFSLPLFGLFSYRSNQHKPTDSNASISADSYSRGYRMIKRILVAAVVVCGLVGAPADAQVWTAVGKLPVATLGSGCTTAQQGKQGVTSTGSALVCLSNVWTAYSAGGGGGSVTRTLTTVGSACSTAGAAGVDTNTRTELYCTGSTWAALATSSPGATVTYSVPGTYSWTVPTGITSVTFYVASGAGGGMDTQCSSTGFSNICLYGAGATSSVTNTTLSTSIISVSGGTGATNGGACCILNSQAGVYSEQAYSGPVTNGMGGSLISASVPYTLSAGGNGAGSIYPTTTGAQTRGVGGIIDGFSAPSGAAAILFCPGWACNFYGYAGGGGAIAKVTLSVVSGNSFQLVVGMSASSYNGSPANGGGTTGNGFVVVKY